MARPWRHRVYSLAYVPPKPPTPMMFFILSLSPELLSCSYCSLHWQKAASLTQGQSHSVPTRQDLGEKSIPLQQFLLLGVQCEFINTERRSQTVLECSSQYICDIKFIYLRSICLLMYLVGCFFYLIFTKIFIILCLSCF